MKSRQLLLLLLPFLILVLLSTGFSENPIVQTNFTGDPAPMVYNDTFYVYTGHDEDGSTVWFNMKEWRCYSSVDMVNWTDHGSPMDLTAFKWANADAWAAQCIPRNGKFYFYVPVFNTSTKNRMIGVAVSDKPTGPFKDAIGQPLLSSYDCCYIDPTVYIDDDDQAYLYWGNPYCFYVKLNDDMVSYSGDIIQIPENAATFSNCYGEAPWLYKRKDLYYLIWAADNPNGKENIRYSTSSSPTGPWSYKGIIMPTQGLSWMKPCTSWTNHSGIVDFKGNSYFVYHNAGLPGGSGFQRSTCIEQFTYNPDGTIPQINMTLTGPSQIGHLNPYDTTQAETICWSVGLKTGKCNEGGMHVEQIHNGDYIKVKGVDFGTNGAKSFIARVSSAANGGNIELYIDSLKGTLIGTCAVTGTGSWQTWTTKTCTVNGAKGIHDLFLKFTGGSGALFNFNWWKFYPVDQTDVKAGSKTYNECKRTIKIVTSTGKVSTLQLDFPQSGLQKNLTFSLFNLSGRLINKVSAKYDVNLELTMNIAGMRPGTYVIKVSNANKIILTKYINLQ